MPDRLENKIDVIELAIADIKRRVEALEVLTEMSPLPEETPTPEPAKLTRKFADGERVMIADDDRLPEKVKGKNASIVSFDPHTGICALAVDVGWGLTHLHESYLYPPVARAEARNYHQQQRLNGLHHQNRRAGRGHRGGIHRGEGDAGTRMARPDFGDR